MKKATEEEVAQLALPQLQAAGRISKEAGQKELEWTKKLISLYKDEMSYAHEIVDLSELFFKDHVTFDERGQEILHEETAVTVLEDFQSKLDTIVPFEEKQVMAAIKQVQKDTGIKGKNLYMPLRVATSGSEHGPSIGLMMEVLGIDKVKNHLQEALDFIKK